MRLLFIGFLSCSLICAQDFLVRRIGQAASGGGTVAYDASSKGSCLGGSTCTAGDTTLTFSHTTGSGSNRGLAVGCTVSGGGGDVEPNISTVTYAGVSLSQLAKRDDNYDTYIWTLPNGTQPATGANNVVVTTASAISGSSPIITCVAISASGVNQTTAWDVSDCTGAGTSTTASCTLSANAASGMLVVFACNGTSIGAVGAGLTSRQSSNSTANACSSFGGATGTGGTTAVSWTVGNDSWEILAAAFKAQ